LASIADVLAISALVDVVFYRGITMQRAVERDSENRSNYAMCAVNPSRISKSFSDAALREVVESISQLTGTLLEIVNYNVEVCGLTHFFCCLFLLILIIGTTICMRRRAGGTTDHDERTQLSQGQEDRYCKGI